MLNLFKNIFLKEKKYKKIEKSEIQFGFWEDVYNKCKRENRPIYTLAPMADVTDAAFRYMINKYGKPDVTWTEFVSANGLMSPGRGVLKRDLEYNEIERPIVAQLFTADIEKMNGAVLLCKELGFDGVDINMGCPDKTIEKQGCGAKMITTPELAKDIIMSAKNVARDMPVSVKTRIGFNNIEYKKWLPEILSCGIPTLTVHLRTRKEMSKVPAHYELINDIQNIVKEISPHTILIINGDIKDIQQADDMYREYSFDGVMIGRGVFGTPWLFNKNIIEKTVSERLDIMLEHTRLFEDKLGDIKSFAIMKKHYKAYINGFLGAGELRDRLYHTNNYKEVEEIITEYIKSNNIK